MSEIDQENQPDKKKSSTRMKTLLFILAIAFFTFRTGGFLFALALLSMIYVHECGHLWAAIKKGFKTNGIYILPIGGVAIVDDLDKADRGDEAYIAVMGPIWGIAFSFIFVIASQVFPLTHSDSYELLKLGACLCAVNIFNLFPISPLDGGRIFKSIAFSISRTFGLFTMILMILLAIFLAVFLKFWILYLVAFFCFIDFKNEKKEICTDIKKKNMSFGKIVLYTFIVGLLLFLAFCPIVFCAIKNSQIKNIENIENPLTSQTF